MMNIKIDKSGFNYSRFVTHMYYLMDRGHNNIYGNFSCGYHTSFDAPCSPPDTLYPFEER